jgi:hypothetical protein
VRRIIDHIYRLVVMVHVFINNSRVKAVGSIIYALGAVVFALGRTQARMLERVLLQSPIGAHLRLLVVSGIGNITALIQKAEAIFH